jgi:cytochrome P450
MGFGARPRGCIGKHLALLASKIAIINLVKRYESIEVP